MTKLFRLKAAGLVLVAIILLLAFGTMSFAQGQRFRGPDAWAFGVHGDTQWTLEQDAANPEYVAASVINAINEQMISKNVKFVLQVGDLTDRAGDAGMASRAAAAQPLFDKGIGFFPLRGNHETYGYLYGRDPAYNLNVPAFKTSFPQTQGQGSNLFGATNFDWPTGTTNDGLLKGLSYAYDYNNASFVIVDVEQTAVKHQDAAVLYNNPAACVAAVTPGTPTGTTPYCGQGYFYILTHLGNYNTGYVVYQAAYDITNGYTVPYDEFGNALPTVDPYTITAGTWFRVASNKRPTTDFKNWDVLNPKQTYQGQPFDIYDPPAVAENRWSVIDSSANTEFWPDKQEAWIEARLNESARNNRGIKHAFVFSHRAIIAENHTDSFFGTDPTALASAQNAFFSAMQSNHAKYMISGHDHLYNRALLASPNASSKLQQIVSIGNSTKFYWPIALTGFATGVKARETQLAQETDTMGYYIYTVDGPRVNVDYYSTIFPSGISGFDDSNYPYGTTWADIYPLGVTPPLAYEKKESYGYSLNGKSFTVAPGEAFAAKSITDAYGSTTAAIIGGVNSGTAIDYNSRNFSKDINTGWVANTGSLSSDILSLWGVTSINDPNPVYALQMSYANPGLPVGGFRLATVGADGKWAKAIDLNIGDQTKSFVKGPYNSSYPLGTQGIDTASKTVWAVVDYDADFAVNNFQLGTKISGVVYNRSTKLYTGTLTVTNTSEVTIRQVAVSLTNLTSGVTLANKTGIIGGSPYISKSIAAGLKAGSSVSIPLSFSNPSNVKINFTPITYSN
jgi:hypothetical protein